MNTAPHNVESQSAFLEQKNRTDETVFFLKKGHLWNPGKTYGIHQKKLQKLKNSRNTNNVEFEAKHIGFFDATMTTESKSAFFK